MVGLALQLFGIGTVIWGISETRALFGHPSLASKAKSWLIRFPLLRRSVVISATGLAAGAAVGKARAYGTHGPGANQTTESRLDALEKNIASIQERITESQHEIDVESSKTANAFT